MGIANIIRSYSRNERVDIWKENCNTLLLIMNFNKNEANTSNSMQNIED